MAEPIQFEMVGGRVMDRLLEYKQQPIDVVRTPFPAWNMVCGEEGGGEGLAKGWVIILAGVPGAGKSNLGYNLTADAVLQGKIAGGINFEMSMIQSVTRYSAILTGIDRKRLEQGKQFSPEAWQEARRIIDEAYQVGGGAFITNKAGVFTLKDIEESYEVLVGEGAEIILLDYAQLVQVQGENGIFGRTEAVANRLRALTHKHNVTSIVLSQFNREQSKVNQPPSRTGLQGGSAWENNANQIVLLDHTTRARSPDMRFEYTRLIGDKNRHGLCPFEVKIRWDHKTGRCEEYTAGSDPYDPWAEEHSVFMEGDDDEQD